jgi:hypothetical protein
MTVTCDRRHAVYRSISLGIPGLRPGTGGGSESAVASDVDDLLALPKLAGGAPRVVLGFGQYPARLLVLVYARGACR